MSSSARHGNPEREGAKRSGIKLVRLGGNATGKASAIFYAASQLLGAALLSRSGVFLGHALGHYFRGQATKQSDTICALSLTTLAKLAHFRNAIGGVHAASRIR
jgi:hypothetical protein